MHWGLCLTLRVFCLAHGVFALGVFVLHRVFCLALRVFAMHWGLCLTLRVFCLAPGIFALHWVGGLCLGHFPPPFFLLSSFFFFFFKIYNEMEQIKATLGLSRTI